MLHILLEYCIGGSIAKLLDQFHCLSEKVIKNYTIQILEGLEYLHFHNVIHRDIKGANILVDRDGICRLSDFGGSKIIASELEFNQHNSFKGTPNWMAPEIIKSQEHSRFSDIWSVGCTIIEMITGEPPWSEIKNHMAALYHILKCEEAPKIPEGISPELKDFLNACFKLNPRERPNVSQLLKHPFLKKEKLPHLSPIKTITNSLIKLSSDKKFNSHNSFTIKTKNNVLISANSGNGSTVTVTTPPIVKNVQQNKPMSPFTPDLNKNLFVCPNISTFNTNTNININSNDSNIKNSKNIKDSQDKINKEVEL